MRVMITGATGFIGYHTVNAMLGAGHEVVLLISNEKKMQDIYGDRIQHHVVGDITDAAAVAAALDGCDGVISIAALVSTDAKDAQLVYDTNVCATQLIVGGAVERGLEKIIHVSSVTALYDPKASTLDENSPPGPATTSYGRSKAACETYVRELQGQGAPVYITYPVSVIGPYAPSLTEPHEGIRTFMGSLAPLMPSGNPYVDVRDIEKNYRSEYPGSAASWGFDASFRETVRLGQQRFECGHTSYLRRRCICHKLEDNG
jgi:nucleoside-diphosphate-sugar epimerase